MTTPQVLPSLLRDWDWQAELKRQGRSKQWLAKATGYAPRTVYAFAYGERTPPLPWLHKVMDILSGGPV